MGKPDGAKLIAAAIEARENAYAPYSNYRVGAAVQTADGDVFVGVNVENASYGLTICAERVAIFTAVAAGATRIVAVAVVTQDGGSPCGACRQVIREFAKDLPIYLGDPSGAFRTTSLERLLPESFGPENLGRGALHSGG